MKRLAAVLLPAFLVAGCVHGSSMDQVHAGMTREQVSAAPGAPGLTTNTAPPPCARYPAL